MIPSEAIDAGEDQEVVADAFDDYDRRHNPLVHVLDAFRKWSQS